MRLKMDQNPPEKSLGSFFSGKAYDEPASLHEKSDVQRPTDGEQKQIVEETSISGNELSLPQAIEDVDRFLNGFSKTGNKFNSLQIPTSLEILFNATEKMVANYDSKEKFGQNREQDSSFLEAINRISRVLNVMGEFNSDSAMAASLNRASIVLYQAMAFMDNEFRFNLEGCNRSSSNNNGNGNINDIVLDTKTPKGLKQSAFGAAYEPNRVAVSDTEATHGEEFPSYSSETISNMNRIANSMISAGYEKECCLVYNMVRRHALSRHLEELGFDNVSIDDIQRTQWESLEGQIAAWINLVKYCSSELFSGERKLCDSVFSEHRLISQRIFSELALPVTARFLNFAEAVALTNRSTEKLFKFLDMYETLRDLIPAIETENTDDSTEELKSDAWAAKCLLGEAAVSIFCELEKSLSRDNSRIPVPSGAVHPLTRYTMNYLKYACEYKDTLEQVFQQHQKTEEPGESQNGSGEIKQGANEDGTPKTSPFSVQLNMVMDLLDENLEMKSKLYKDPALRYVFLMNNGRYILQKIKGSTEIYDMMGLTWCRKRSTDMRQYHKLYTRETWSRVLQCLNHDGLTVNGKVNKDVLKERFKTFTTMLDEIHRSQSTWVVSDEQLQSELRVSVSAVVIPAYRSFLGRFNQYLSSGRQTDKYIKYQPDDIENLIEELFDGNPLSMNRRRT